MKVAQQVAFEENLVLLENGKQLYHKSKLLSLQPFLDELGLMRLGGRMRHSKMSFAKRHPVILPGQHAVTKLVVRTEHLRLLHAGPTLTTASLSQRYHILSSRRVVRSITRSCVTCRRYSGRPQSQLLGQLPPERVTPGSVFQCVGVDYAGPVLIKGGSTRKPVVVRAYVSVFVSFNVKAVHLEPVSELTSAAFIAAFRRFIARRGKPRIMWSDHGTNFIGAARELKELYDFLKELKVQQVISEFCSLQNIEWKLIPERAPHFGGLWESAVKSMKSHFKKVVGDKKLTFEEITMVLAQIEACLNSRPLAPLPDSEDAIEALTPGHFLTGAPLEALPDPLSSYQPLPLLRPWQLCQVLVRQFWQRWSAEYLQHLHKFNKWKYPTRNVQPGDIVCVREEGMVPSVWPLAKVESMHPGKDGLVRVATLKTPRGVYKRPITKIVLLLPTESC